MLFCWSPASNTVKVCWTLGYFRIVRPLLREIWMWHFPSTHLQSHCIIWDLSISTIFPVESSVDFERNQTDTRWISCVKWISWTTISNHLITEQSRLYGNKMLISCHFGLKKSPSTSFDIEFVSLWRNKSSGVSLNCHCDNLDDKFGVAWHL